MITTEISKNNILKLEFISKIKRDYSYDQSLVSNPSMLKYLPFAYSKIVQPMREEIRQMMFEMHIASESDIIGTG